MSYVDIVICVGPLPILETWPPIYRGQERTVRDRLKASQVNTYVYFRYTPCLTDFTFGFIQRPIPPILSPSYWTFVELTLVSSALPFAKGTTVQNIVIIAIASKLQRKSSYIDLLPYRIHSMKHSNNEPPSSSSATGRHVGI
jgi:hypothetical protein